MNLFFPPPLSLTLKTLTKTETLFFHSFFLSLLSSFLFLPPRFSRAAAAWRSSRSEARASG